MLRKDVLKSDLLSVLRAELQQALDDAATAHSDATHEEARPENDKDTRSVEASYLARGLAMRADDLSEAIRLLESSDMEATTKVSVGSLVGVRNERDVLQWIWIVPAGGGRDLVSQGVRVQVITGGAPLARALLSTRVGDEVELPSTKRLLTVEVAL